MGFHRAVTTQLAATIAYNFADECGEAAGGVQITIQYQSATIAGVDAFGQAQLGFHHTTTRTSLRTGEPPIRDE
jgi:hypothetical protein